MGLTAVGLPRDVGALEILPIAMVFSPANACSSFQETQVCMLGGCHSCWLFLLGVGVQDAGLRVVTDCCGFCVSVAFKVA